MNSINHTRLQDIAQCIVCSINLVSAAVQYAWYYRLQHRVVRRPTDIYIVAVVPSSKRKC